MSDTAAAGTAHAAHGRHLVGVRPLGSPNDGLHPECSRSIRDGLAMVPRRGRDDAARPLLLGQLRDQVDPSPDLKGPDGLGRLKLEIYLAVQGL